MPQPLPPSQPSASRYILTALATILVITTFILVGLNALNLQKRFTAPEGSPTATKGYQDGYLAARAKYSAMCPFVNQRTNTVTGVITATSANSFTITQNSLDTDPIVDGIGDERTIAITPQTQITKNTPKDPKKLAEEQAQFIASNKSLTTAVPPSPVIQEAMSIGDLRVGQSVLVQSTASDIRFESTIYAQTVTVKN